MRRNDMVAKRRSRAVVALVAGACACAALPAAAYATTPVVVCASIAAGVPCPSFSSHPTNISLGSDGRTELMGLHWTDWSHASARGSGVLREDEGPAGRPEYLRSRAVVSLSRIERCDG